MNSPDNIDNAGDADNVDFIDEVFATGAFCAPFKWTDPETGEILWRWVVCSFEDDSFRNGENVNVQETADTRAGLIIPWD
ncbi:MAG: hypothetical protein OXU31_01450 [Gammaproteobacteria bacterium]|nr:hypothetical protein [Gammaproteobacteria bacterium]